MFELRRVYPTLNDGFYLETMSNQTQDSYFTGSDGTPSPFGIWSIYRSTLDAVQDLDGTGQGNQGVWLVYSNKNQTTDYSFDCQDATMSLVSPFAANVTVKNLFYPYDEYTLTNSTSSEGCLSALTMAPYGFKAFVPLDKFVAPTPVITGVVPSHDSRISAEVELGQQQNISIEIHFSTEMDCDSVTDSLTVNSTTQDGITASVVTDSISCASVGPNTTTSYVGEVPTNWIFSADLQDVSHGVHTFTVNNASAANGSATNSIDRFMFRVGDTSNPIVFPTANYSSSLLHRDDDSGSLYVTPNAAGADKFRYSTTWGSSWSSWMSYTGSNLTLDDQAWSGTSTQEWKGQQYVIPWTSPCFHMEISYSNHLVRFAKRTSTA